MSVTDIVRFIPVSDLLATSGQPSEAQLADLAAAGYECIINLALHDDPRYSLRDEPASVTALGMHYVHIPVQFVSPTAQDLSAFFKAMLETGRQKTLIHCAHNKRVPVFLALHRIRNIGWPRAQAVQAMHEAWVPDELWQSFFDRMSKAQASTPG